MKTATLPLELLDEHRQTPAPIVLGWVRLLAFAYRKDAGFLRGAKDWSAEDWLLGPGVNRETCDGVVAAGLASWGDGGVGPDLYVEGFDWKVLEGYLRMRAGAAKTNATRWAGRGQSSLPIVGADDGGRLSGAIVGGDSSQHSDLDLGSDPDPDSEKTRRRLSKKDHGVPVGPAEGAILLMPCVGSGPKSWPLMPSKVAEWREAFPAVDIVAEVKKAKQWCADNPSKRKTFVGMTAFLGRWLGKAQDRGGASPGVNGNGARESRYANLDR